MEIKLESQPGRCEEASPLSGDVYIPCNAPAVRLVAWLYLDGTVREGPYRMCANCAAAAVARRGARDRGVYNADA